MKRLRTFRLGKYFSASSLSVALILVAICSALMPSIVVGICVGSELGRPLVTVTVPRLLSGISVVWVVCCAQAPNEQAASKAAAMGVQCNCMSNPVM